MNVFKTSLYTTVVTILKMLSLLAINKIVSVVAGPAGLTLIAQFMNAVHILNSLAQGGVSSGVVKFVAEYDGSERKTASVVSNAFIVTCFFTLSVVITLLLFSKKISIWVMGDGEYSIVFTVLGLTIVFSSLNALFLSILNGMREIKKWALANIAQSLWTLIITSLATVFFGVFGALFSIIIAQAAIFLIILRLAKDEKIMTKFAGLPKLDFGIISKLLKFSFMALVSALSLPIALILVRNEIISELGEVKAGLWQASWYVSSMFFTILTSVIGVYYLPRLSQVESKKEIRQEITQGLTFLVPIAIVCAFVLYLSKDFILFFLFAAEFHAARELFLWQLMGDVVKVAAWLFAHIMLAKAMIKAYVLSEVFVNSFFVVLSIALIGQFGLIGVSYSALITFCIYFFMATVITRNYWL